MSFSPIAIVGRACLLPGADSPEALWELVRSGRVVVDSAPNGRWAVDPERIRCASDSSAEDATWSDKGGYVRDFDAAAVGLGELSELDPVSLWSLHVARQTWADSERKGPALDPTRSGAIFGNLSFPSAGMARYAAETWFGEEHESIEAPVNRFNSSGPAKLLAQQLGLGAEVYCLDAACASALYAIKLACDQLHAGYADFMLAGAVNSTDDLFIHIGFCALQAMSPSGQSRPFHCDADGLVPAEGAAFVGLMRLSDAVAQGRIIHGVIRGVGVSNDGRGRGLLSPMAEGQARAMRSAYEQADMCPSRIGLLECHATGTSVGDAVEIESSQTIFGEVPRQERLALASLKSNMGHLITSAGAAGLIKILESMKHQERAPIAGFSDTELRTHEHPALGDSAFRLLHAPEPWPRKENEPRAAGISAFGFGGNNAHLIVEEYEPQVHSLMVHDAEAPKAPQGTIAIVGLAGQVGDLRGPAAFAPGIDQNIDPEQSRTSSISLSLKGLRFPPKDLAAALAQQTLSLQLAREALADAGIELPRERTGVFIGMEADPEVARYGARWRLPELCAQYRLDTTAAAAGIDEIAPILRSAGVLGTMPNIPANRISSQVDAGGPGFTVSAGADSGLRALDIALGMLRRGELDVAIVGCVDLTVEAVNARACTALGDARPLLDAAMIWILCREKDASRDGLAVYATLDAKPDRSAAERSAHNAGAATGLLQATRHVVALAASAAGQATVSGTRERAYAPPRPHPLTLVTLEGPTLSLPAHPAPVPPFSATTAATTTMIPAQDIPRLPPMESVNNTTNFMSYKEMPSAPILPTTASLQDPQTMAQAQEAWVQPTARMPAQEQDAILLAPSEIMPTAFTPPADPSMALHIEHTRRLGQVQRDFMATQTALHQRFLEMQQQAEFILLSTMQAGAVAAMAPVPVVAPLLAVVPEVAPMPAMATKISDPVAQPQTKHVPAPPPSNAQHTKAAKPIDVTKATKSEGKPAPFGPTWNFEELKIHASGNISEIYGPEFALQDQYALQVRMPEPPLLLTDRVTGIDAPKAKLGKGTIWTESDVNWDHAFLHAGRLPAGIMIESGQADLMLISYMGIDLLNKGERVYRLLGCELTYHGEMPKVGDTLCYDIHLDGHANQGDIRLMFFHYNCEVNGEPRLSVRKGQAGFFTTEELAESAGCLWTPEEQEIVPNPRLAEPQVQPATKGLTREQLVAFSEGRSWDCFGDDYDACKTHTRSPSIAGEHLLFLDRVTDIINHEQEGGPWKRGYLRAEAELTPDHWFFKGHFKNDPCMPGTLMLDACLQTMAIYMAAQGMTLKRDGYRFAPVKDTPFQLQCRGQATPTSKHLVYEVFVEEIIEGDLSTGGRATLYADLLVTIDGLKAFHARRVGLELVPDWPLHANEALEALKHADENVAISSEGHAFGQHSLLACAWGRPSAAFGPIYDRFDGQVRVARLPGPPYLFMSRISKCSGALGGLELGSTVDVEFDVPRDAWYFNENGYRTMPYAVVLEAALQPCGWLASYIGSALTTDKELVFRNLDGTADLKIDILEDVGTLTTHVELVKLSQSAGMVILDFEVKMFTGQGTLVYEMDTVFGFFPSAAMENQTGLPTTDQQRAQLTDSCDVQIDLSQRSDKLFAPGRAKLAQPMLLMIDRVTAFWPEGGEFGKGRLRGEKDVDKGEWFFKAHFYQDPVQPGSLGIEAMAQLLQIYMLSTGMDEDIENPRFEAIDLGRPMTWKYRGQVVPTNKGIQSTLDIVDTGRDERGPWVVGNASLWVDGKRIYEAKNFGMRIVSGKSPDKRTRSKTPPEMPEVQPELVRHLDPGTEGDDWISDHCPTYTVPALPMMCMLEYLAQHRVSELKEGEAIIGLKDVRIKGWCVVDGPIKLTTVQKAGGTPEDVCLMKESEKGWTIVASARVLIGPYAPRPKASSPLTGAPETSSPYQDGRLFHGPAFQVLQELILTGEGASAVLSAESGLPLGVLNPGLLDGATHAIQHDNLTIWHPNASDDKVAYPAWIPEIEYFGPTPTTGQVSCEIRPDGHVGSSDFLAYRIELITEEGVWCKLRLIEAAFDKGPLGRAPRMARRRFLHERQYAQGVGLSSMLEESQQTRLRSAEVDASNWLPGTIEALYGTTDAGHIATAEHIAQAHQLHPGTLPDALPLHEFKLEISQQGDDFIVKGDGRGCMKLNRVKKFWNTRFGVEQWPIADLYYGLVERFMERVVFEEPASMVALRGRSVLYVANHQVGIESLIFSIVASGLLELPTRTLAKAEHAKSWLGRLIAHAATYPDIQSPDVIEFFDRSDAKALPGILAKLGNALKNNEHSLMVHVEGTRARGCGSPVQNMSGTFIELALTSNTPIVPVRFVGGLPPKPVAARLEFPVGMGKQSIFMGTPIMPEELRPMHYKERTETVLDAINNLSIPATLEQPAEPQDKFGEQVGWWMDHYGVDEVYAVLGTVLSQSTEASDLVKEWQRDPKTFSKTSGGTPETEWMRSLATLLVR